MKPGRIYAWMVAVAVGATTLVFFFIPQASIVSGNPLEGRELQASRAIVLLLFQYARDHDFRYPTGKSSTEVFQKLIDEKYASDPEIFWFQMPGKIRPTSDTLKPENVCWDVTADVDANSPDDLPVVFMTGYRMTYEAGGHAVPLFPSTEKRAGGMALSYKSNVSMFLKNVPGTNQIRDRVISPGFHAEGKRFRQLTPEGVMGP